jgi:hypothetical protein
MGITILAVLSAIGGVFGLLGGGLIALVGGAATAGGAGPLGGFITIIGFVAIAQAVLSLAFAYGAWTLKPWAWTLGMVVAAVGIVVSALFIINGSPITSQIISIAISAVIIYYLNTPAVKAAFGRA